MTSMTGKSDAYKIALQDLAALKAAGKYVSPYVEAARMRAAEQSPRGWSVANDR